MTHTEDTNSDTDEITATADFGGDNRVVAAFSGSVESGAVDRLGELAGVDDVGVLTGPTGLDALTPDSFLERLQRQLSEERRPLKRLEEAIEEGGSVVVVSHDGGESTLSEITKTLVDSEAEWAFEFSDLTWTELHSPQSNTSDGEPGQ